VKFPYNCEPLFITVFFIYRIPRACVIKFAVMSSIFVSTETKYVSQIHLDVSQIYCASCHRRAFQAFAVPLLFDGKWPDCVRCLMLPGKIATRQSSVEWNEFRCVPSSTECNSLIFVYTVTFHFIQSDFLLVKGPFIFYEGGGAGGIWETPFKNRMTPPQLINFFTWPPPYSDHFLGWPPPKKNWTNNI